MALKPAANSPASLAFGDMSTFVSGGGIPEGKYALEFQATYEQETDNYHPKFKRVGVLLIAHPLEGGGEPKTKFLSFGSTAHDSWAPNAETGKSFVPVPNGKGMTTLNNNTNWGIFLKSLYDCGLPQGVFVNDLTPIDGVHVHLVNRPEPADRASFRSKAPATAEVKSEEKPRQPGVVPVVTEILEGGMPWAGGGGLPGVEEAKPATKPNGKVAPKPAAASKPATTAPALDENEVMEQAVNAVAGVLEKNPDGCGRLILRTNTFKAVKEAAGDDMANAVITTFFGTDDNLNLLLSSMQYEVKGQKVSPVA